MKIAVLAPVWIPVPPDGYGGIERVLKLLVDGLVDLGHEVTLYASGDSRTKARQVIFMEDPPTDKIGQTLYDAYHVGEAFREMRKRHFDLVSDHSGFLGVAFAPFLDAPLVHTLHGPFHEPVKRFYRAFNDDAFFIAISECQRSHCPDLNYLGVAPNAVDTELHRPSGKKEDYYVCVGRVCEAKGTHHAVRIARETGVRLKLAGKIDAGKDYTFFQREVQPFLDGDRIVYLGEVSEEEKVELVARARGFLFPIQWEEPFGLVMAESLACGTPVITTHRGAAPEVVEDGKTGFVVRELAEFPRAMRDLDSIDPAVCRTEAEHRFSPHAMALRYVSLFHIAQGRREDHSSVAVQAAKTPTSRISGHPAYID